MKKIAILAFSQIVFANAFNQTKTTTLSAYDYIEKFKNVAIQIMHATGVPAAITLAQGLLETGNGNSDLAILANNHFGIKASHGWTGNSREKKGSLYRSYDSATESYVDHANFLKNNKRYSKLFKLNVDDYISWGKLLHWLGYAEDPKYGQKIKVRVEKYGLLAYNHPKKEKKNDTLDCKMKEAECLDNVIVKNNNDEY